MSKVVENQVVQMQFDNKEFQKNVNASMKSLDDFQDKMDFKNSSKSFNELEKASERVDFRKLNEAIDGVGEHFSIMGRTVYKVVDKIADYFTSKITSAVNTVKKYTTDIIDVKAGYAKYDEYTNGVKTILYALSDAQRKSLVDEFGSEIEGVEEKLSELMWYTDETSYNFTDMVGTIGKFMGAGLNLDDAIKDMQGIANWAALSGQNATVASQAMYQLSQALGRGNLQYSDWAQAANLKNMGTTAAKDVFIDTAIKQGYIKEEDIAQAKKMKGEDRNQWRNYFFESEALNDNAWFKTSVLEGGLQEFSKASSMIAKISDEFEDTEYSATNVLRALDEMAGKGVAKAVSAKEAAAELLQTTDQAKIDKMAKYLETLASDEYKLGREAFAAAQKAYTFTDAVNAVKDAVTTKWAGVFTKLVGNAEEAAELWTGLSNKLWDIFAAPLDNLYWGLKEWSALTVKSVDKYGQEIEISVRKHLWEGVGETLSAIGEVIGTLGNTIKSTIHYIRTGSYEIAELTAAERNKKIVDFFENLRKGLHNAAKTIRDFVESEFFQTVLEFIRSFGELIRPIVKGIKMIGQAIVSGLGKTPLNATTNLLKAFTNLNKNIGELIEEFIGSNGFQKILMAVSSIVKQTAGRVKALVDFFLDLTDKSKGLTVAFKNLGTAFNKGVDAFRDFVYNLTGMDISIFTDKLKDLVSFVSDTLPILIKGAGGVIGALVKNIAEDIFGNIPDAWNKMCDNLENGTPGEKLKAVLEFLGGRLHDGIQVIIDTIEDLTGADLSLFTDKLDSFFGGLASMLEKFSPGIDAGWEAVKSIVKGIGSVFVDLASSIFTVLGQITGIEDMGPGKILDLMFWILEKFAMILVWIVGNLSKAIQAAGPYLEACADIIKDGFGKVCKAFNYLIGVDKSPEALKSLENIKKALKVVVVILLLLEMYKFYKKLKWFLESWTNLADVITGKVLKQSVLQQITGFIKGIATIMIAISILANQDIGGIAMAMTALVGVSEVVIKALEKIMHQMKLFANNIAKNNLTDKQISQIMSGVNKIVNTMSKIFTRIGVAIILISIAKKIGGSGLIIEQAMAALSLTVLAMSKGLQWILKSLQSAKISDSAIKKANKVLKTMSKALLKIAVDVALLTYVMDKLTSIGSKGDKTAFYAMGFLAAMVMVLSLGTSAIITATKSVKPEALNNAAVILAKMSGSLMLVVGALALVMLVLEVAAIDDKALELVGITILAVVGIILVTYMGMALVGHFAKPAQKASDKAGKAVGKLAKTLAKTIGNIVGLNSMFYVLSGSVLLAIASMAVITLAWKAWGAKILIGFAATALLFTGAYFLIKMLGKLKFEGEASNLLKFAGMVAIMSAAVLTLSAALAIICLLASMPSFIPAAVALGIMLGALIALAALAPKMSSAIPALSGFATASLGVAASCVIFAVAIKMLADLSMEELGMGMLAIIGFISAMLLLATIVGVCPTIAAGIAILATAFMEIGIGMSAMVIAVLLLTFLSEHLETITKQIEDLAANIGPLVDALLKFVIAVIDGLADSIDQNADAIAESLLHALIAVVKLIFVALGKIVEEVGQYLWDKVQEAGDGVIDVLANLWAWIFNFPETLKNWINEVVGSIDNKLLKGIVGGILNFFGFLLSIPGMILKWIGDLLGMLYDFLGIHSPSTVIADIGMNCILGFIEGVKAMAGAVWETIKWVFNTVMDTIKTILSPILDFGKGLVEFFVEGIQIAWKLVKNIFTGNWKGVWEALKEALGFVGNAPKKILELGKNLVSGLINGIEDAAKGAIEKVKGFGKKIIGGLKSVLGINSPSKETFDMAINLCKGLVNGLASGGGDAISAVKGFGESLLGNFLPEDGLASVLNMGGIADQFTNGSFYASYDLSEGLDKYAVNVDPNVDPYAFQSMMDDMDYVYDMDTTWGGSAQDWFSDAQLSDMMLNFSNRQLSDITSSYDDGSNKIVDAIKDLSEQVEAQAVAISEMKIVLDTGVLAGELSGKIDEKLGTAARLKARTGG